MVSFFLDWRVRGGCLVCNSVGVEIGECERVRECDNVCVSYCGRECVYEIVCVYERVRV